MDNQQNISKNKISGQSAETEMTAKDIKRIDDDFLSGDNKKKTNQDSGTNAKSMSPGRDNPNIGGDENEYEDTTPEEDLYDEEALGNENPGTPNDLNYDTEQNAKGNSGWRSDYDNNYFF